MGDLLVRDVTEETLRDLKESARLSGRSVAAEARDIIAAESKRRLERAKAIAFIMKQQERWKLEGRTFSDSTELIRQDRDSH